MEEARMLYLAGCELTEALTLIRERLAARPTLV